MLARGAALCAGCKNRRTVCSSYVTEFPCAGPRVRKRGSKIDLFFFQAEDGIRDYKVTGVQTCALPIWTRLRRLRHDGNRARDDGPATARRLPDTGAADLVSLYQQHDHTREQRLRERHRSEERRVGKECRSRWSPYH